MKFRRRDLIPAAALAGAGAYGLLHKPEERRIVESGEESRVAVLKAASYEVDLEDLLLRGVRECGLEVRGKNVLLKPNLVEFDHNTCVNTDARVVAAAAAVFEKLGAATVTIAEGPGHRRDTWDLAHEAKYRHIIPNFDHRFTDLNRDDVSAVSGFATAERFYFPNTVLRADLIVSLAKMKTHHWAGATLSMKNYFGLVPGSVYGWPKNQLHYFGIEESILALHRRFAPRSFAIVDGIVGMEGNGPIQGAPKNAGVVVLGKDLRAVDSTSCRVMGINPLLVGYLANAASGRVQLGAIRQVGEQIERVAAPFGLLQQFQHLRIT